MKPMGHPCSKAEGLQGQESWPFSPHSLLHQPPSRRESLRPAGLYTRAQAVNEQNSPQSAGQEDDFIQRKQGKRQG